MTLYRFEPPTTDGPRAFEDDWDRIRSGASWAGNDLSKFFATKVGKSVLKIDGEYQTVQGPDENVIATATEAYIGGHTYTVSASVAAALQAAGYTVVAL